MATRIRRGKEIEVPEEWLNKIPTKRTLRHRKQAALIKVFDRNKRLDDISKVDWELEEDYHGSKD